MTERSIKVRSPCEINRRVVKYINPFRLAGISEGNALGSKIVLKISCSFFGQSFGLGHYPPTYFSRRQEFISS